MKNHIQQKWHKWLAAFFAVCILCGSGLAYAAPMLWSYPNDHFLISEVNVQGAPGSGPGTEWIELYNPTGSDVDFDSLYIWGSEPFLAQVPTPLPSPMTVIPPTQLPIGNSCFVYLAYDAGAFYNEFNQCPDFAEVYDTVNCPDTRTLLYWHVSPIHDVNNSLCLYIDNYVSTPMADAIGWGNGGGTSQPSCSPVANPLPAPALTPGITYLRGSDAPEWIGPGGEGAETPGAPLTEQLAEVWRLSSDINVSWEGPEAGVCRAPTAVTLQHPNAQAIQDGGTALALFGFIGLLLLAATWNWRYNKPTH